MRRLRRKTKKKRIHILSAKQVKETIKKNWGQIILSLFGIAILILLGWGLNSFLFASEYFNVKEIEIVDQEPEDVEYSLARIKNNPNIFKIDLQRIADNIEYEYSDIQKAIVKRVLPNKLVVEVLRRRPVAQIALGINRESSQMDQFFTVNKDGYILNSIDKRPKRGLPIIAGLNLGANEIEPGHAYMQTNLKYALSFLETLDKIGFDKKYSVTKIDISQPRSMSFFIRDKLEVKIGDRNLKEKIENLAGILENMDIDYSQEYYIDLRFKDFVFGKK